MKSYSRRPGVTGKFALLFVLGALAGAILPLGVAGADELKTITWTPPTQCENGDAIGATEQCGALSQYRLQCNHNGPGSPYLDFEWFVDAPATSDTRSYPPGDYWCRLSVHSDGVYSKWSEAELFFSIAAPPSPPNAPTGVTVADSSP